MEILLTQKSKYCHRILFKIEIQAVNILINLEEFIENIENAKNYKDILIIISNYISSKIKKKRVGGIR